MSMSSSTFAINRETGKHQVDQQRASILDAAEALFLQNGLEKTSMSEIAERAGITRVTLSRYFANRDEIAVEIQVRMIHKMNSLVALEEDDDIHSLEGHRRRAQSMIRNFSKLKDVFRYIGMFDKIYLDDMPDVALTRWTKNQLRSIKFGDKEDKGPRRWPYDRQLSVVMNNVIWFLEKLALRGELTWGDQDVPMEEHLKVFEEMVMGYFDRLAQSEPGDR